MQRLFERGNWEELEKRLEGALAEDPADARSAFRLANLRCLLGRPEEALPAYDTAWSHHWPGVVCLNNKAVAHAQAQQARAALATLQKALRTDGECGPAAYNLGILLQRLGEESSLPKLVRELDLLPEKTSPKDFTQQRFVDAAAPGLDWGGDRSPLDGPLYLWEDDLQSAFGFEQNVSQSQIDAGHQLFREAREQLERGEWANARSSFDEAKTFYPDLEPEIVPLRNKALVAQAKELREKARERKAAGDYEGYRNVLETHNRLAAEISGNSLENLVVSEIRMLGEDLRHHRPSLDWRQLQTLISMVRQKVEPIEESELDPAVVEKDTKAAASPSEVASEKDDETAENAEVEETEAEEGSEDETAKDERSEENTANLPENLPNPEHQTLGQYVRGLCRDAWGQQLRYLTALGDFDAAEQMLDFSELQWFGRGDVAGWRRSVYTAKAEHLAAQAQEERHEGEKKDATSTYGQAREAAEKAGDAYLVDRLDQEISQLMQNPRPKKDLEPVQDLLRKAEYVEAIRVCTKMLEETPQESRLRSWRGNALHHQRARIRGALEARQWSQALEESRQVLEILPDDEPTRELAERARRGLFERRLSEAENTLTSEPQKAWETCEAALEMYPTDRRALELRRRIKVAREVDPDAADETYDSAWVDFENARAAREPTRALAPLRTLRRLEPKRQTTKDATEWYVAAQVEAWRRELEESRKPATVEGLLEDVELVLDMVPNDHRVLAFREELRREEEGYGETKRERSVERLRQAQGLLQEGKLLETLDELDAVAQRGEPTLQDDVRELREDALGQLHRRIESLLRKLPDPDKQADLEPLLRAYEAWAPDKARPLRRELEHRKGRPERSQKAREDLEAIKEATLEKDDPVQALKTLYQKTLIKHRQGSDVLAEHEDELANLYRRIRRTLGPFQRLRAWWHERWNRVDRLFGHVREAPREEEEEDHDETS